MLHVLGAGYDAKSVNDYNALGQKASIMRGVTMKSRGVLDWLTSNNSNQSSQYKVLENMVYDKNTGEPIAYGKATSKTGLLMKMAERTLKLLMLPVSLLTSLTTRMAQMITVTGEQATMVAAHHLSCLMLL